MRSIDVHAHLTPQCFWQATENGGDWHTLRRETDARGMEYAVVGGRRQALPPRARWTPEARLADMDSLGVDVHVLSTYVGFYNYHLPLEVARATSTATNDEIAGMVRAWPDRFAGLAAGVNTTVAVHSLPATTAPTQLVSTRVNAPWLGPPRATLS